MNNRDNWDYGMAYRNLHSWELTWKPKRGPIKTTVPLKWGYMGFHVCLGECKWEVVAYVFLGFWDLRAQGLGLRV